MVFSGKPEYRRPSVRLNLDAGLQSFGQWLRGEKVLIKGNGYQNWEIVSFEKITASGIDLERALRDGLPVCTEEELKTRLEAMDTQPLLAPGTPVIALGS